MRGRLLAAVLAGVLTLTLAHPIAMADDPGVIDVTDPTDVLEAQGIDPMLSPQTSLDACWTQAGPNATNQWIVYKTFHKVPNVYPIRSEERRVGKECRL